MNIFVRFWPFLSDQTGTVHVMGTLNSAIKIWAYLRKEEAIAGSTEMLRWKTSLPYPKFFMHVAGTYQET